MDIDEWHIQGRKRSLQQSEKENCIYVDQASPATKKSARQSLSTATPDIPAPRPSAPADRIADNDLPHPIQNSGERIPLRYAARDMGPFVVYVYPNNRDGSASPLHSILVSRIIAMSGIPDIQEIKKIGRGKILIVVKTATAANRLVENSIFPKHNLRAFIPAFKVLRTGVIQDVPQEIGLESLKESMESPAAKILDVQRLNRRIVKEGKPEYVPSRTVRVRFAGQILPQEVFVYKVRHTVRPFIPKPRICNQCYRVGHISTVCKGAPRCLYCGENKHEFCQHREEPPRCINCNGNHWANDNNCPIIRKQRDVVSLAATENISIMDAKNIVDGKSSFPSTSSTNANNFPSLPRDSSNEEHFESYNRFSPLEREDLAEHQVTYANVLKSQPQPLFASQRPRGNIQRNEPTTKPNRPNAFYSNRTQYNAEAHRDLLFEANGRTPRVAGNGEVFKNVPPTQNGFGRSGMNNNAGNFGFAELISLVSEIFSHLQNSNFVEAFNTVIKLVQKLGFFFQSPHSSHPPPHERARNAPFPPNYDSNNHHAYCNQPTNGTQGPSYDADCGYGFRN
ncbi:hypothetical protein ALC57_07896 [Trachymyrmex cornetzi]|uniref:Nucleic-acid-binding protein from transposon X-element n=1 Tax=Trachymyrmex cornetzi TaxID=471704 RepID=A0A151J7D8_9HYME|nr:hypothetical protein ALC57_07896 [Trachymyrmex cornetzi]